MRKKNFWSSVQRINVITGWLRRGYQLLRKMPSHLLLSLMVIALITDCIVNKEITMIKLKSIKDIVKYALASGKLEDERPLSVMIIAPVESAKTLVLRRYCLKAENCLYMTDVTAHGILKKSNQLKDFRSGRLSHLVIADLMPSLSRKQTTVSTLISFLNSLIEEGIVNISTYITHIDEEFEVRAGLLTAIPSEPFRDHRRRWGSMGFLSRALPVTYGYKPSTRAEILSYIESQEHLKEKTFNLKLPDEPKLIELPFELAKKIEPYASSLADEYSKYQKVYGFRYQRQLQTLVKAIALLKGKDEVDKECLDELEEVANYINFQFNKI